MSPAVGDWHDFLIGAAGAAGALAGLVFVALSINLSRILSLRGVSGRAAETLMLLAAALLASLLLLIPATPHMLGIGLVVIAIVVWLLPLRMQWDAWRGAAYPQPYYAVQRSVVHQCATIPGVIGALSLLGFGSGGMYWIAAGILLELIVALLNAWVLLVEIMR